MSADLTGNLDEKKGLLNDISERTPVVTQQHRERLEQRITHLLEPHNVELNQADLVREIAIFADRSDISEEVVRSQSHIAQFADVHPRSEPYVLLPIQGLDAVRGVLVVRHLITLRVQPPRLVSHRRCRVHF